MTFVTLPRSGVPVTLRGDPMSSEWFRWAHDITARVGGATGAGLAELAAQIEQVAGDVAEASEDAAAAGAMSRLALSESRKTVEVPADVLRALLARVVRLERRLKDIEDMPL